MGSVEKGVCSRPEATGTGTRLSAESWRQAGRQHLLGVGPLPAEPSASLDKLGIWELA